MTTSHLLPKVLITNTIPSDLLSPLSGVAEVIMGPDGGDLMPRAEILRLAPTLSAIINQAELRVDGELLNAAPVLRIVANAALGTDNLDLLAMQHRGVVATNTPEAFVEATADCTLAQLLALTRKLPTADAYVRSGQWKAFQPGFWDGVQLSDMTLGIVGYGKIGQAVARRARAFGMRILWNRRTPSEDPEYRSLDHLLAEADAISLHAPLTPQSRHLIGDEQIRRMKTGALLVNMGRGALVDENALIAALKEGTLGGAVLDVFENEPNVPTALREQKNVILSPHLGGATHKARRDSRALCIANVAAVLTGHPAQTPVSVGV